MVIKFGMMELYRVVMGVLRVVGDARGNLERYLGGKVRPEFLVGLKVDKILNPLVEKAHPRDGGIFKEDLVDMFIDGGGGDKLVGLLLSHAEESGLSESEAEKVIHGGGLDEKLRGRVKDLAKKFEGLVVEFMYRYMTNMALKWQGEHKDEVSDEKLMEEGKEVGVLDEREVEEGIRDQYAWEEGLIKDVIHLINTKVDKDKRGLYKVILRDRFLSTSKKNFESISKVTGVPVSTIEKDEKRLAGMLREFLKAQGLGPKFDVSEKEVEVPVYTEFLKDEGDIKDLKGELKTDRMSPRNKRIMELLAEGRGVASIAEELGAPLTTVRDVKNTYFDVAYSEWYKDRVEEIRKASNRLREAVVTQVKREEPKKVEDPKVEEEEVETKGGMKKMHEKMVDDVLDHERIRVTISFEADFDHMTRGDKGDDPHFKWVMYEARVDEERRGAEKKDGTRSKQSVEYLYHQKLKDDGEFEGEERSELKLNGEKVSSDNILLGRIDDHMEKKVLTEGVIPHGMFPVSYVNTKTGKDYLGTREFKRSFSGLFVPDKKHKERVEKEEKFQERKRLGPQIGVTERAKAEKLVSTLERELKTEKDLSVKRKQEIREHIYQVKDWLRTHTQDTEGFAEIMDIIKQEQVLRHPETTVEEKTKTEPVKKSSDYDLQVSGSEEVMVLKYAAALPETRSAEAKKLMGIFEGYGISKPNPRLWLESRDVIVLARTLKAMAEQKFERDTKNKPKGMKSEDWDQTVSDARKEYKKTLDEAEKLFPEFIKDLKVRKDEFVKQHPADYKVMANRVDMTWVDDKAKVDEVETRVTREMHAEVKGPEKKDPGMKMLEQDKFKAIEGFLEASWSGFDALGKRVHEAGLKPLVETDEKLKAEHAKLLGVVEGLHGEFEKRAKILIELKEKKDITDEESKQLKEIREKIPELRAEMMGVKEMAKQLESIPALGAAKTLRSYLKYFSSLYNYFASVLWFRMKDAEEVEAAAEEKVEKPKKEVLETELTSLRDKIMTLAGDIARTDLKAKDQIKSAMGKLRMALNKFIDGLEDLKLEYKVNKAAMEGESYEEALKRYVIPEDLREEGKTLIKKIREKQPENGLIAAKEFEEITQNIVKAYKEGIPLEKMEELAKKKRITVPQAAIRLKKHQEALGKAAIDKFILTWQDILEAGGRKKEKSPLGNKPHGEYDRIGKFVEDHIPDLFTLTPSDEEEKLPSAGIPTPKDIRESIERVFGKEPDPTPEELRQLYKAEASDYEFGGGGGGKSKGRAKAMKPPVPHGTWEEVKGGVKELLKKDPEHVVLMVMAMYAKRVRDAVKEAKQAGEYIEVGAVIDGFVYLLKQFYNTLLALRMHPSAEQFKLPPPGAPKYSGIPDFPIDNYAEAMGMFNKMREIYEVINTYIKPDHVGVPPESIKNIRSDKRYLPLGLGDWLEWFAKKEGKLPKSPDSDEEPVSKKTGLYDFHSQMSFNVAQKFASSGDQMASDEFEAALS